MNLRRPLFLLLAFGVVLSGCSKAPVKSGAGPVPVEVAVVTRQTEPVEIHGIGTVQPISTVQLKAKVEGEITQVLFSDGAYVKAGQPLFTIDPRPFDAALQRAQADYDQAQTEFNNAQSQADRYKTLDTQGVTSKEQAAQFLTTAASLKSALAARQADLDQAKLSRDWATVTAPIAGRAGAALLKVGNIVQANTSILAVINQTEPIYVSFSLPETELADVRSWMSKTTVTVTARDSESRKVLGTGQLNFIDNTVDVQSGMVAMKATFPNSNESLWPGQFVDVVVTLTQEADALVVPSTSLMEGQDGSQVFVVNSGTAALRKVEVERVVGDHSVVQSGLQAGETVISVGQLRVANGAKVYVPAPAAAASPGAAAHHHKP